MVSMLNSRVRSSKYGSSLGQMPLSANSKGVFGSVVSMQAKEIAQVSAEQVSKLNELAKHRPFNILYKVKRYDPL